MTKERRTRDEGRIMENDNYSLRDFDYDFPQELIAQSPARERDGSRLMVIERKTGEIHHRFFSQIQEYFKTGDCLVINNTKVIPARLFGRKGTGAKIEVLLLKNKEDLVWESLIKPVKRVPPGSEIIFGDGILKGKVQGSLDNGKRVIEFDRALSEVLDRIGRMPLPPYIKRGENSGEIEDRERYQTVYASVPGAVAAPTAGLHFTTNILEELKGKGVKIAEVTLHVGYGTFKPVESEDISLHKMHSEKIEISEMAAKLINETKQNGGSVIAVGTTAARALETSSEGGRVCPLKEDTDIFIYPPYRFKVVDKLITNFHLPKSTLIMLVSALAGKDLLFRAYKEAVENRYRFYSYGDAMLIV